MTLTREQAAKLHAALHPTLGYLCRLRERMDRVGFLPDDRLRRLVEEAYLELHSLCVTLHYMSCHGGVG